MPKRDPNRHISIAGQHVEYLSSSIHASIGHHPIAAGTRLHNEYVLIALELLIRVETQHTLSLLDSAGSKTLLASNVGSLRRRRKLISQLF